LRTGTDGRKVFGVASEEACFSSEVKPVLRFDFEVKAMDFSAAGVAAKKIKEALGQMGVAPETVRRAAIAVYEAEMNTIIHAHTGTIVARFFPNRLIVTVSDQGPGIKDLDLAMTEGFSTAPDHIRELGFGAGMGLPNMKQSTDGLRIETVEGLGTRVTLVVCFQHLGKKA